MKHLSGRQFEALIINKRGEQNDELRRLRELVMERLCSIVVSQKLPPIERPTQGKHINCTKNVAQMFREEINRTNTAILHCRNGAGDEIRRVYQQFLDTSDDKRLQSEAIKCI